MIQNDICQSCGHYFVCKKMNVLDKFDSANKKYIGVDISILSCKDYANENIDNDLDGNTSKENEE